MKQELKAVIKERIEQFQIDTNAFHNNEILLPAYKKMSGGFGSYAQRGKQTHMVRYRIPGGMLSSDDVNFINSLYQNDAIGHLHITTNQNFQFHDVAYDHVSTLMLAGLDYGIHGFGSGGNYPRNVTMSPLSGLAMNDYFDCAPFVKALTKHLYTYLPDPHFPRKLKCGVSSNALDESNVTMRDLGFKANPNGTFDVYICGGLGPNARTGIKVAESSDPNYCVYHYAAFVEFFRTYGDYEKPAKARSRYILETYGEEATRSMYHKILEKYIEDPQYLLHETIFVHPNIEAFEGIEQDLYPTRDGFYAYYYQPRFGNIDKATFAALNEFLQTHPDCQLRLTPKQALYVVGLRKHEIAHIRAILPNPRLSDLECSVACVGSQICQIGIQDSPGLLKQIQSAFASIDHAWMPLIQISGCANSCGAHQGAQIGFAGTVKVIDKQAHPAFELYVFGDSSAHPARLGEKKGVLLASDIPAFLLELNTLLDEAFVSWYPQHKATFDALVANYLK